MKLVFDKVKPGQVEVTDNGNGTQTVTFTVEDAEHSEPGRSKLSILSAQWEVEYPGYQGVSFFSNGSFHTDAQFLPKGGRGAG
jgi:hypothetical protein